MEVTFMQTKKGNGYKLVVGGTWLYTSKELLHKAIEDGTVCTFRTLEDEAKTDANIDEQDVNDNGFNETTNEQPASSKQVGYLKKLGAKKLSANLSMKEASAMISELKEQD